MKAVCFYLIHNLLYETKVIDVTKLLKVHVKNRSFSMGCCKHDQKKYIISQKTTLGYDVKHNVNARIILLHYIYVVSSFS